MICQKYVYVNRGLCQFPTDTYIQEDINSGERYLAIWLVCYYIRIIHLSIDVDCSIVRSNNYIVKTDYYLVHTIYYIERMDSYSVCTNYLRAQFIISCARNIKSCTRIIISCERINKSFSWIVISCIRTGI